MGEGSKNIYLSDEYVKQHPTLHEKDAPWKIGKIIPMIDILMKSYDSDDLVVLDVGGGGGTIMSSICNYIDKQHDRRIHKILLDLSPQALKIQQECNPDCVRALNEDIEKTSLTSKEADLTLMIDVLEHLPEPEIALEELRRISRFVIFKVPLEDCAYKRIENLVFDNLAWRRSYEVNGHVNFYNEKNLRAQIQEHCGQIVSYYFTKAGAYALRKTPIGDKPIAEKIWWLLAPIMFLMPAKFYSKLFADYLIILVDCR